MAKQRSTDSGAEDPASDDAETFRAAVRDIKPLVQIAKPAGLDKSRARRHAGTPAGTADAMPLLAEGATAEDAVTGADALSFRRPGVRTQVLRRLRRGLYPIEDELDLHGLGQAAARDTLAEFIAQSRNAGRRCIRIIH